MGVAWELSADEFVVIDNSDQQMHKINPRICILYMMWWEGSCSWHNVKILNILLVQQYKDFKESLNLLNQEFLVASMKDETTAGY